MILRLPFWRAGITPHPRLIVVRRGLPAWRDAAVVAHEHIHVAQQVRHGWLRFLGRYLLSVPWRCRYEAEAYAETTRCYMETHPAGLIAGGKQRVTHEHWAEHFAGIILTRYHVGLGFGDPPSLSDLRRLILRHALYPYVQEGGGDGER